MNTFSRIAYDFYVLIRIYADRSDTLFKLLINFVSIFRKIQKQRLANFDTNIVIEGFPRSANTYLVALFNTTQGYNISIAHHLHASYQVRFAEKNNIPCVVLVRDPIDSIASSILRNNLNKPETLFKMYKSFYSEVINVHKRSIIVEFKDCINDPNIIIRKLNKEYQTQYKFYNPGQHKALIEEEVDFRDNLASSITTIIGDKDMLLSKPTSNKKTHSKAVKFKLREDFPLQCAEVISIYNKVISKIKDERDIAK